MGGGASAVVGVLVVFGHTPARCARVPFRKAKGEGNGVLCFTLGSRVRGNDGVVRGESAGMTGLGPRE